MLEETINQYREEIEAFNTDNEEGLEQFRQRFIGRKNVFNSLFSEMKNAEPEQKKELGQKLNDLKTLAQNKFNQLIEEVNQKQRQQTDLDQDLTLPPPEEATGSIHPLTQVRNRIIEIFERIGFNLSTGPEIEDDWHNFTALNFPENHPAREMQDTFFIEKNPDIALRTHTSSVQVRIMENQQPPIRTLSPGRVYRNEAISARAHCVFHQIEGLYINEDVSFADLKQTLLFFAREFFGPQTDIRLRPSYFPFTEPSAELDIYWGLETEDDYRITKGTGWLEIGGCGMVDPNVLTNNNIDPEKYSGFAFGIGIERIAMIKYQIKDLRLFTENDVRFLKQFAGITM